MKTNNTGKHTDRSAEIKECVCEHQFQDERFGKGKRVMNPCLIGKSPGWRCTVCGREHN